MNVKNGLTKIKNALSGNSINENELEFELQMLTDLFLSEIDNAAKSQDVSRKELAKRVNTSASYITQLMRGNRLPNLKILTAMGLALDKKFNVVAVDDIEKTRSEADESFREQPYLTRSFESSDLALFNTSKFSKKKSMAEYFFETKKREIEIPQAHSAMGLL